MNRIDIVYFSSACPQNMFDEYFKAGLIQKLPQAQRFNLMLIKGLAANEGVTVHAISMPSFFYQHPALTDFKRTAVEQDGVSYVIPGFSYGRRRRFDVYCNTKKEINRILEECKGHDVVFIVDALNQTLGTVARRSARRHRILTLGIVTDVPTHRSLARFDKSNKIALFKHHILSLINLNFLRHYHSYMFLTEAMNKVINVRKRPFIVIEGMIENDFKEKDYLTQTPEKKVLLYAGGIHREFGIPLLVEAFLKAAVPDAILRIYGNGNYMEKLTDISKNHANVEYLGTTTIDIIHEEQRKAFLLVNPRLTDADYVSYSFPSKTLECMASGTPLLMTRLPSMPDEYKPFVFLFEQENPESFSKTLSETLNLSLNTLNENGRNARNFVLSNKNNVLQAKKLISFMCGVLGRNHD